MRAKTDKYWEIDGWGADSAAFFRLLPGFFATRFPIPLGQRDIARTT